MKTYYLAYGSNLNLRVFKKSCPNAAFMGITFIYGYTLMFRGTANDCSYLTLEEDNRSYVPAAIFEISKNEERNLDKYEDYPHLYHKKRFHITTIKGKPILAMAYVMNKEYHYYLPSKEYIEICSKGYNDFKFDKSLLINAINNTANQINKSR